MTRTFYILAVLCTLLMVLAIAVGFWSFFLTDESKQGIFILHFYLGLGTVLVLLLVHCLIFTYFLGTGRWVKEVGIAYSLNDEDLPKTTRELKRRVFPPALFAMLFGIATAAAGAGAQLQFWPWPIHASFAFLTLGVNLVAFHIELDCLRSNAQVLQNVLLEVDRIREAKGLNTNAEALIEEEG